MSRSTFLQLFLLVFVLNTQAQSPCNVTVSSNNGYSVNIRILPVSIVPSSQTCPYGYNYNVALNYTVTFTGSNIPSALHTLQGNITCNVNQSLFFSLPLNGGTGSYTTSSNPYISSDGTNVYTSHPSCTAATVSNLNCNAVSITINGPGMSNQSVNCVFGSPLPVELVYFRGEKTARGNLLSWMTQTEKNNNYFTIEKSVNGLDWLLLGTMPGSGNSNTEKYYSFYDDSPATGINYYRLKQTDYDERNSYAPLIYILNSPFSFQCSNVFPNPAKDKFSFLMEAPANGQGTYKLLNDVGQPVKSGPFNYYNGSNTIELSAEELPAGFYLLEVGFNESTRVFRKLVKQ